MSSRNESQLTEVLSFHISPEMEQQLRALSIRFAKVMTLQTRVGKATIAREAMTRGMSLMVAELEALEQTAAEAEVGR